MGKIKQGILGAVSGKVGGVVGSSWKGIAVIKSLPASVANPRTAGQVAQRSKMSSISAFASEINASVIKPLWDRFQTAKSGYNAFVQSNISLFATALPTPYDSLVLSKGKMAATEIDSVSADAASTDLECMWLDDAGEGYKLDSDECYCVAVNRTQGLIAQSGGVAVRSDLTVTVSFANAMVAADEIDVYLAFRRADGTIVSNSYAVELPAN